MRVEEPESGWASLRAVLDEARERGFLGPGPVDVHLDHARGFAAALRSGWTGRVQPQRLLDLGSGGGVPGLVLAQVWPECRIVLLEAGRRRADFLVGAVASCDLGGRVTVDHRRAEIAGRDPGLRGRFDAVSARSFGRPGVTAECAAPFLEVGGALVVSEPPADDGPERWPADGLAQLGMGRAEAFATTFKFRVMVQVTPCPDRYPRRDGVPDKRPLF